MLNTVVAIFIWLLGLCVGSFLNVVIYRLPLGKSLWNPKRSFCPACGTTIRAMDNIPVVSWLLLGGRCRVCRVPISVQYPLIEAATGLVFVLVFRLLQGGASPLLADFSLPVDWPLLAAWLVLAAVLVACSGMDFVSYMIDTRITNAAVLSGLVLLAVWPRPDALLTTAQHPLSAAAVAALLVGVAWLYLTAARDASHPAVEQAVAGASDQDAAPVVTTDEHPAAHTPAGTELRSESAPAGLLGVAAMVSFAIWLFVNLARTGEENLPAPLQDWPALLSLALLFLVMVVAGSHPRTADHEIASAIENEGGTARQTALREFVWLLPALLAGALTAGCFYQFPHAATVWSGLASWSPGGGYVPLAGLTYSMAGVVAGIAAGWFLRIFFTLVIGREAFGIGDIYILSAAGAIGGWDIALLGLLLSVGLATAGWLLSLLFKSTLIIPFGPWLALGFVSALWLQRPAEEIAEVYRESIEIARQERPELLWLLGAILLAGTVIALAVARLARRMLECPAPPASTSDMSDGGISGANHTPGVCAPEHTDGRSEMGPSTSPEADTTNSEAPPENR